MRSNCPSDQELHAFLLGALSVSEFEIVAGHLETCPVCQVALDREDTAGEPLLAALRRSFPRLATRSGEQLFASVRPDPTLPENWPSLPGYEVLACLGSGGMGVVYKARQVSLNRLVALKKLHTTNDRGLARLRLEADLLARLQHPSIVPIHEVLDHDGATYLVLELVAGGSLEGKLVGKPQPVRATAELVETVARAAHHAHAQGIVHRDLKPANILLSGHSTSSHDFSVPKITDLGMAKLLGAEATGGETQEGDILGTPAYMSPEQAIGKVEQVGAATDVYSIGVILYEMLTGRVPFQGASTLGTLMLVRCADPVPPRRLQPSVPRDLDTICLKCLEKEPEKRYTSAEALADDLRRFLEGRPILARPTPLVERARKWAVRQPAAAALSAAIFLVSVVSFSLVAWQWQRAEREAKAQTTARAQAEIKEQQEKEARLQIEKLSAGLALERGASLCDKGEVRRGLLWLVRSLELAHRAGDANLEIAARRNLAAWQPFLVRRGPVFAHKRPVWAVALSPDARTVVTGSHDSTAQLWDVATGKPRGKPLVHPFPLWCVTFSPDGKLVLAGTGPGSVGKGEARLWDAVTGQARAQQPPVLAGMVHTVAFFPDSKTYLTACQAEAQLWRTEDSQPIGKPLIHPHPGLKNWNVLCAGVAPDGKLVATGGEDGLARLWDPTGLPVGEPLKASASILTLTFSPDSHTLLTGCIDGNAYLWDVTTGQRLPPLLRHTRRIQAAAFSPDGEMIATAATVEEFDPRLRRRNVVGGEVQLWHTATGRPLADPLPHPRPVRSLAFSPGGRILVTGCEDAHARFFATSSGMLIEQTPAHEGAILDVAFGPGGTVVTASAGGNGYAAGRLWHLAPEENFGKPLLHGGNLLALNFSPDGKMLLGGADDWTACLWDVPSATPIGPASLAQEGRVSVVAFAPDGKTFVTGAQVAESGQSHICKWDSATRQRRDQVRHPTLVCSGAFAPDGRAFLIGGNEGNLLVWEQVHGAPNEPWRLSPPIPERGPAWSAAFGADGTFLTATPAGARLWSWEGRHVLHEWSSPSETAPVTGATFEPAGKRVLLMAGGFAQMWDPNTGNGQPPRFHPEGGLKQALFHPAGHMVLLNGTGHLTRLWDVSTGKTLGPPLGRDPWGAIAFRPDGRMVAVASSSGRIALWPVPLPLEGEVEAIRLTFELLTGMELDAQEAIHELREASLAKRREQRGDGEPH